MKHFTKKILFSISLIIVGCGNNVQMANSIVGEYHSHSKWGHNDIFIKLKQDSAYTFLAIKEFCPGTKYFCSIGKWSFRDSIVTLKYDTLQHDVKSLFPEISDSINIIQIALTANFIVRDKKLYNIELDGKSSSEQFYDKTK